MAEYFLYFTELLGLPVYDLKHRRIGRVYVFGGVLPASIAGFCIALAAPFGLVGAVSNTILATLWLFCTITGYSQEELTETTALIGTDGESTSSDSSAGSSEP